MWPVVLSENKRIDFYLTGLLQKEHPAEYSVQEMPEDRKLHHRANKPKPLPAVPLQEVFIRRDVA